jgi:hypothetical protein
MGGVLSKSLSDPADHSMDHRQSDHRLAPLRQDLVIPVQPAIPTQSCESPLHHPAMRQELELLYVIGLLNDDLQT